MEMSMRPLEEIALVANGFENNDEALSPVSAHPGYGASAYSGYGVLSAHPGYGANAYEPSPVSASVDVPPVIRAIALVSKSLTRRHVGPVSAVEAGRPIVRFPLAGILLAGIVVR